MIRQFDPEIFREVVEGSPALRIAICEQSPMYFAAYYFPEYFEFAIPPFHYDMYQDAVDLTASNIDEVAWIVHREGAKTSLAKIAVAIYWICYKKKQYINWDSEDKANAEAALFDITLALQTNKRIINDFGHLYYKKPSRDALSEAKLKRINNFITENGIKVEAFSTHVPTRGRLFNHIRPDAFILDDFENSITKDSFVKTKSVIDHIDELRSGLSSGASVLYLGNYITDIGSVAYIMETLKRSSRGRIRFVPVVNSKGEISWPDKYVKTNAEAEKINQGITDPRKRKVSLEAKRESLTDPVFETEMMLNPSKSGDLFFDRDKVEKALTAAKEPILVNANFKIWSKFNPKHRYGMGADTAEGIGSDSNASAVIDFTEKPNLLVGTFEDAHLAPDVFGAELKRQGAIFGLPYLVVEINNTGYATVSSLINEEYPTLHQREVKNKTTNKTQKEYGWRATIGSVWEVLGEFKSAFEDGELVILDSGLLEEMKVYTKAAARLANRQKGATRHYDKLRAAALAWYARKFAPVSSSDKKKLFETPGFDKPYRP